MWYIYVSFVVMWNTCVLVMSAHGLVQYLGLFDQSIRDNVEMCLICSFLSALLIVIPMILIAGTIFFVRSCRAHYYRKRTRRFFFFLRTIDLLDWLDLKIKEMDILVTCFFVYIALFLSVLFIIAPVLDNVWHRLRICLRRGPVYIAHLSLFTIATFVACVCAMTMMKYQDIRGYFVSVTIGVLYAVGTIFVWKLLKTYHTNYRTVIRLLKKRQCLHSSLFGL